MSATRSLKYPNAWRRNRPTRSRKKKHDDDDGPDFGTLVHAWIESHRASLLDSLRRRGQTADR